MEASFYACESCCLYFPTNHPKARSFFNWHVYCILPKYVEYSDRLHSFDERGETQILSKNDIPDTYTCTLSDLELLAYACIVSEPEKTDTHLPYYVLCRSCSMYFPLRHPDATLWRLSHERCPFKGTSSKPENMGISYSDNFPAHYICVLSPVEQLAYIGLDQS